MSIYFYMQVKLIKFFCYLLPNFTKIKQPVASGLAGTSQEKPEFIFLDRYWNYP